MHVVVWGSCFQKYESLIESHKKAAKDCVVPAPESSPGVEVLTSLDLLHWGAGNEARL